MKVETKEKIENALAILISLCIAFALILIMFAVWEDWEDSSSMAFIFKMFMSDIIILLILLITYKFAQES
jgi:hypothetical protein